MKAKVFVRIAAILLTIAARTPAAATATSEIDASGKAVSPGFINMLSWATVSLIEDGRGMGDLKQGVTFEVMGEGWSMGPWNQPLKHEAIARQRDIKYDIEWTTLGEYLDKLTARIGRRSCPLRPASESG